VIRINHIRLRSISATKIYGADIPLKQGLNIIQAHNTSGKSTSLQSIIYALGLERSLGPQLSIPLPYSMRERVKRSETDPYETVIQSYVEIEIENGKHRSLIVRRDVTGGKDSKLIQTWAKGTLDGRVERGSQRDFYVLDGGSAQREDGFYNHLAEFLGWTLPIVPRFDGTESPLYLEAIFPMIFVEQKRGWSAIQGPFPTFLKIQDIARRVMEFLLDLDAGKFRRKRSELRSAISAVSQRWTDRRAALEEQAQSIGRLRGIPMQPSAEFALAPDLNLELHWDEDWVPISDVLDDRKAHIQSLEEVEQKTTEDIAPELERQLDETRQEITAFAAILEVIRNEFAVEQEELQGLQTRLTSLRSDLVRNQDAFKLKKLGSNLGRAAGDHVCPTCHQDVSSELLPQVESVGMGLEENIRFVKSQIELYEVAHRGAADRAEECRGRYRSIQEKLSDRQANLRSLRQAMVQPNSFPTRVMIEQIGRAQAFVDRLASMEESAAIASDELQAIARDWVDLQDELKRLPPDELTPEDDRKVNRFESLIQEQLNQYKFGSFNPDEIRLSRDNFRPLAITLGDEGEKVEKEIGFEISASDGIRLKWAYYFAMLHLAAERTTNHPGVLIFDEPGQQEIEAPSLYAFLANVAANTRSQQVIISTSEPLSSVEGAVGENAHVVSFDGFILQPIVER